MCVVRCFCTRAAVPGHDPGAPWLSPSQSCGTWWHTQAPRAAAQVVKCRQNMAKMFERI